MTDNIIDIRKNKTPFKTYVTWQVLGLGVSILFIYFWWMEINTIPWTSTIVLGPLVAACGIGYALHFIVRTLVDLYHANKNRR
jgi:apolipoprotein N-acyltransferase